MLDAAPAPRPDGSLVPLAEQDRRLWDRTAIAEGVAIIEATLPSRRKPGPYQLQAAIAAVHDEATDVARDRLAADPRVIRRSRGTRAWADGRAQPDCRRRDGARPGRRACRTRRRCRGPRPQRTSPRRRGAGASARSSSATETPPASTTCARPSAPAACPSSVICWRARRPDGLPTVVICRVLPDGSVIAVPSPSS